MHPRLSTKGFVRPPIGPSVGHAFWAVAPKGQCPVEHRGEFPYVRTSIRPSVRPPPGQDWGL